MRLLLCVALALAWTVGARAEVKEVRAAKQYGLGTSEVINLVKELS